MPVLLVTCIFLRSNVHLETFEQKELFVGVIR